MPATVQRSGQTTSVRLFAETVDERSGYLHELFLEDISHENGVGALWSMEAQVQGAGVIEWLTVSLQGTSFQGGDVVQVSSIPGDPITTGVWAVPIAEGGKVQVVAQGFTTASASGTIQVLGVGPLRLTLDIRASNAAGEEIGVQGDMTASAGQTQACFSETSIPVAVSVFPDEQYHTPRSWAERAYPGLIHYNQLDKGGHFAAWEQPKLLVDEMRVGLRSLR
jgi:hypothetical protein